MEFNTNQIPFAPIFHPTWDEFKCFKQYIYKISKRKEVKEAGVAKVF